MSTKILSEKRNMKISDSKRDKFPFLLSLKKKGLIRHKPKLSVILIVHNMQREAPRTIRSLCDDYQMGTSSSDYEVIIVENGSSMPLSETTIGALNKNFSYHYIEKPPPSPAFAINFALRKAKGDIICVMIDGACILTPGVFRMALKVFLMFDNPIVLTRYFFLGPDRQNVTIKKGYNQSIEDELLRKINWPESGYRLFEIGTPLYVDKGPLPNLTKAPVPYEKRAIWLSKMFESNCLFLKKSTFEDIGGCNEKFDMPGGGFLNLDIYREAARIKDTELVQLIGEAVFHQIHGGRTTNISMEAKDLEIEKYKKQYEEIRGELFSLPKKPVYFFGHIPKQYKPEARINNPDLFWNYE